MRSPVYIETTKAWYILGVPAPEYRVLFSPFFRAHKIAQVLVCALMRDQRIPLDEFVAELRLANCMAVDGVSGENSRVPDMSDVKDAVLLLFLSCILLASNDFPRCDERSQQSLRRLTRSTTPQLVLCVARHC